MPIVLVGLNHQTAPVVLREQLALADCGLHMALEDLKKRSSTPKPTNGNLEKSIIIKESIILSTCNRLEVYAVTPSKSAVAWRYIEQYLADLQGLSPIYLQPHLYFLEGQDVVDHIVRVASGLESMILGEPQILGQVSKAHAEARRVGATGPILSHLFDTAVHAGKRARTETEIGRHTTSVSHAAVQLAESKLGDLSETGVLVVGAGEMAVEASRALLSHNVRKLNFINRTYARADDMARQFEGKALNWGQLPEALISTDLVVTATGAPHIVIHTDDVFSILSQREDRPLLIVDIAVPRDVEDSVGELSGVERVDIDHLQSAVETNLSQRKAAIPAVETIITQEALNFDEWYQSLQVLPVLVALRRKAKDIAETEIKRNIHQMDALAPECQEKVSMMVHRIVNKLLHDPTIRLKASAAEGNGIEYARAVRDLFDLEIAQVKTTQADSQQNFEQLISADSPQPPS